MRILKVRSKKLKSLVPIINADGKCVINKLSSTLGHSKKVGMMNKEVLERRKLLKKAMVKS